MVVPWTEDLAVTRCPELAVQFPAPDLALKAPVWAPGTAVGLEFFGAPVGGAGKFPGGGVPFSACLPLSSWRVPS